MIIKLLKDINNLLMASNATQQVLIGRIDRLQDSFSKVQLDAAIMRSDASVIVDDLAKLMPKAKEFYTRPVRKAAAKKTDKEA